MNIQSPVMRYHGAKYRLAPWIMGFFPEHHTYVEPYGGAAGVLMQKPRSQSEVYNDLDGDIVNVFRVLQSQEKAATLLHLLTVTPYAREEFEHAFEVTEDAVEMARRTIIRASMGFGSGGATKNRTGFRVDSYRSGGTASQTWANYPEQLWKFCHRLQGVLIENKHAMEVISNHDRPDTLFYMDPPYVTETRTTGKIYRHEMTSEQHAKLLISLLDVQGMVVLSGYDNGLYNDILQGWEKHQTQVNMSANRGSGTRIECVWLNPACAEIQSQRPLFG